MNSLLDNYLTRTPKEGRSTAAIAYLASLDHIGKSSPEVQHSILQEIRDQRTYLKLIASENYSSYAVQLAMGNLLTDKYAEGYPDHRFYAGCDNVDAVEKLAADELVKLFGAESAYVQPHSGADANLIAFWAILLTKVQNKEVERLGKKSIDEFTSEEYEALRQLLCNQKVMGMALSSGGHLTHGYRHNVSSRMMKAVHYEVNPATGLLDYDALEKKVLEEKPLILLAGYSSYPRKINFERMRSIADKASATLMVDMAHFSGLVAGKVFTGPYNPIPYADIVTSTTHKTLRGPRGGFILAKEAFKDAVNKGCPLVMGGPLPHVMAAKAIAFKEANTQEFRDYAARIVSNADTLAKELIKNGIDVVTGGTENHLLIIDLRKMGVNGRQAEKALRECHMTVNRNAVPNDPNGPWYTSGIRIGTPALTTLGMGKEEMKAIAKIIADVLKNTKPETLKTGGMSKAQAVVDSKVKARAQEEIRELLARHPLYPELEIEEAASVAV